jgi:hypothetical protein
VARLKISDPNMLIRSSIALIVVLISAGVAVSEDKPPRKYVDVGACPFECCTYRMWTVNEATTLWNEPGGKAVAGSLRPGDLVQGLTGEVISKPIAVRADHNFHAVVEDHGGARDTSIPAGDTFYILHYAGEGAWKVWLHGKIATVDDSDITNMAMLHPKADWWVKVKDVNGNVGWTLSDRHFLHQDACE